MAGLGRVAGPSVLAPTCHAQPFQAALLPLFCPQDGAFNGVPASGKTIEVTGINIMRIEQGQIHEIWGSPDVLGLLQQIGAIPMPG